MEHNDLSTLAAFLSVAEERSFTRAAKRHGVTPSAMSHAIRELEEGLGVRLLSRTTRSVSQISGLSGKPAGRVRLLVPRLAAMTVVAPKLGQFARDDPDIGLDVTADDSRREIG